jgi:hypothetical protein
MKPLVCVGRSDLRHRADMVRSLRSTREGCGNFPRLVGSMDSISCPRGLKALNSVPKDSMAAFGALLFFISGAVKPCHSWHGYKVLRIFKRSANSEIKNRKSRMSFKCYNCGFEINADHNAAGYIVKAYGEIGTSQLRK